MTETETVYHFSFRSLLSIHKFIFNLEFRPDRHTMGLLVDAIIKIENLFIADDGAASNYSDLRNSADSN